MPDKPGSVITNILLSGRGLSNLCDGKTDYLTYSGDVVPRAMGNPVTGPVT